MRQEGTVGGIQGFKRGKKQLWGEGRLTASQYYGEHTFVVRILIYCIYIRRMSIIIKILLFYLIKDYFYGNPRRVIWQQEAEDK